MSAVTYVGIDANPSQSSIGDALLEPLRFCGRQWNSIAEPLEDAGILWKAAQVAQKAILAFALIVATGLAAIPALIGSIIKTNDTHIDTIQCDMDSLTQARCLQLGIHDPHVREATIAGQICSHHNDPNNPLPYLFASIFVSRRPYSFENGLQAPATHLDFAVHHSSFSSFVDHIISCFKVGSSEEIKIASLQKLSDVALGIQRLPLNPLQPFEGGLAKNYSRIVLSVSNDLRKMEVKAFT